MKARRWWNDLEEFLAQLQSAENSALYVTTTRSGGQIARRCPIKALQGRGRKRPDWVDFLHSILLVQFEIMQETGVKINKEILKQVAFQTIHDPSSSFTAGHIDDRSGKPITELIKNHWIQAFLHRFNIVIRKQNVSLSPSEDHRIYTRCLIAHHLGQLQRDFQDGVIDENMVENMDETHFVFNQDNHYTLGFIGQRNVNYADVVSGGEGMTMVLRLSRGVNSKTESPFMIFKNKNRNYSIQTVPGNVPGVSYRTGPRAWMDKTVFDQWLNEPRAIDKDPVGRKRFIFMDNCSGHNGAPFQVQSLQKINAEIRKLPPDSTHLCQSLDSFVIQKVKEVWRKEWELEKLRAIERGDWANAVTGSGKLNNPKKKNFMKLAAKCVEHVNNMKDENNISYSRKSMIRCGLALDNDGTWKVEQLFPHLREIVEEHHMYFCGFIPETEHDFES